MEFLNLNNFNVILLVIAVAAAIFIAVKIAGRIFKTVAILLVAVLVVYFWQGGSVSDLKDKSVEALFKDATIEAMLGQYCPATAEEPDDVKCLCIVRPVHSDLTARFTEKEIREIDQDDARIQAEIRKSFSNKKKEIKNCLVKNKGSEYLDKMKDVFGKVKDFATEDSAGSR